MNCSIALKRSNNLNKKCRFYHLNSNAINALGLTDYYLVGDNNNDRILVSNFIE